MWPSGVSFRVCVGRGEPVHHLGHVVCVTNTHVSLLISVSLSSWLPHRPPGPPSFPLTAQVREDQATLLHVNLDLVHFFSLYAFCYFSVMRVSVCVWVFVCVLFSLVTQCSVSLFQWFSVAFPLSTCPRFSVSQLPS